jgi:hypothetical protein
MVTNPEGIILACCLLFLSIGGRGRGERGDGQHKRGQREFPHLDELLFGLETDDPEATLPHFIRRCSIGAASGRKWLLARAIRGKGAHRSCAHRSCHVGARFSTKGEMPSCASRAIMFSAMTSAVYS